jgi:hypothetical protein
MGEAGDDILAEQSTLAPADTGFGGSALQQPPYPQEPVVKGHSSEQQASSSSLDPPHSVGFAVEPPAVEKKKKKKKSSKIDLFAD